MIASLSDPAPSTLSRIASAFLSARDDRRVSGARHHKPCIPPRQGRWLSGRQGYPPIKMRGDNSLTVKSACRADRPARQNAEPLSNGGLPQARNGDCEAAYKKDRERSYNGAQGRHLDTQGLFSGSTVLSQGKNSPQPAPHCRPGAAQQIAPDMDFRKSFRYVITRIFWQKWLDQVALR